MERNTYSVPARLIGEWVEARVSAETIEVWYGRCKEDVIPRLRGRAKHHINYRLVIEWLVRKPGAFAGYRYRAELFPTSRFRMAWDTLRELVPSRATKRYLAILHLAAVEGEARVDDALRGLLEAGEIAEGKLTADSIRVVLMAENMVPPPTHIAVADVVLANFDELLGGIADGEAVQ